VSKQRKQHQDKAKQASKQNDTLFLSFLTFKNPPLALLPLLLLDDLLLQILSVVIPVLHVPLLLLERGRAGVHGGELGGSDVVARRQLAGALVEAHVL